MFFFHSFQCDVLELDQISRPLVIFPLLTAPSEYFPDTEDLTADVKARTYWLDCFKGALDDVVARAVASQSYSPDVIERGEMFRAKYLKFLEDFSNKPL